MLLPIMSDCCCLDYFCLTSVGSGPPLHLLLCWDLQYLMQLQWYLMDWLYVTMWQWIACDFSRLRRERSRRLSRSIERAVAAIDTSAASSRGVSSGRSWSWEGLQTVVKTEPEAVKFHSPHVSHLGPERSLSEMRFALSPVRNNKPKY